MTQTALEAARELLDCQLKTIRMHGEAIAEFKTKLDANPAYAFETAGYTAQCAAELEVLTQLTQGLATYLNADVANTAYEDLKAIRSFLTGFMERANEVALRMAIDGINRSTSPWANTMEGLKAQAWSQFAPARRFGGQARFLLSIITKIDKELANG